MAFIDGTNVLELKCMEKNGEGETGRTVYKIEFVTALRSQKYLEQRAARGKRDRFEKTLSKVGNHHPLDKSDIAIK